MRTRQTSASASSAGRSAPRSPGVSGCRCCSISPRPPALLWDGAPWLLYHYNLPGRAVLQPVWAVFFVVGFLLLLVRLGGRKEFLLLVTLLLGLGPTLLTSTDAIFMRSIYALPLLYIVSVRGAVAAVDFVRWRARSWDSTAHTRWSRAAGAAVAVIVVAAPCLAGCGQRRGVLRRVGDQREDAADLQRGFPSRGSLSGRRRRAGGAVHRHRPGPGPGQRDLYAGTSLAEQT